MAETYSDRLLDHYRNPRRKGRLGPGGGEIREVEEYNPLCGDRVTIALRLVDGHVAEARFDGRGCALCLGAASILCEMVEGQPVDAVAALDQVAFLAELQAEPRPARLKCALLPWIAFRRALCGHDQEPDW